MVSFNWRIKGDIRISGIFEGRRNRRKVLIINEYTSSILCKWESWQIILPFSLAHSFHLASSCMAFVQLTIRHDTKLILQKKNDLFISLLKQSNFKTLLIIEHLWREKYFVCGSRSMYGLGLRKEISYFFLRLTQVFLGVYELNSFVP